MKILAYSLLFIPLLFSCGGGEEEDSSESESSETTDSTVVKEEEKEVVNSFLIEENMVGLFQIGKEVPDLPDELSVRQYTEEEEVGGKTQDQLHNVVFNQLEDLVELNMNQGSGEHHNERIIEEMWVLSNFYETSKGIKVGSSIEDFREAYPNAKAWYSPIIDKYFLDTEDIIGAQFIIDAADVDSKVSSNTTVVSVAWSRFNPEAKVHKIRMY